MKIIALALSWLFVCVGSLCAAEPQRPNIVFILADDLGWRDLGCYGSTFHQTPHLDKLAARGVRFTQAYAANPLCSPTRSSILTGMWPARTGITAPACHLPQVVLEKGLTKGNPKQRVLVANSVTRLKTEYVTLPKVLHEAGYRTGHFGKWHLGAEPYSALQHGFDVDWPHWPGPGPAGSYVAPWKFPATLKVEGQPGKHIEETLSSQVVKFIRENKDRPFYVNYWQFSVHAPYDAKDELVAKYRKLADPQNPQRNPVYAAMVESLDAGVGRVLAALDECGLAEKTIIVFFSDNGGVSWAGRGRDGHKSIRFQADMTSPPTGNLPLRNGKASLYEGGVREPCLVVWPRVTKAGSVNDTVIQSIDWMPTLLDMAGEGVFLQFSTEAIRNWLATNAAAVARGRMLLAGFDAWSAEHAQSRRTFPGLPYIMLHSFSHLLITAVSLECGYPASSIRERIYAIEGVGYGILLYTGSPDAEGTLGGLVEAGRRIAEHVQNALRIGELCSNDPVCAQHQPENQHERRFLHGAACHGCLLIAETSCEQHNQLLDRALVVPTVEGRRAEFFTGGGH